MFPPARLHLTKLILWAAPLAGLACGGDGGTDIVLPSLTITTATSGVEIDPDGYSVSIDGQAGQPTAANATLTIDRLADGQHTVELSGIAGNCAVGGQNPGSVSVASGSTATLAFEIICSSATGSIQVMTTTSATSGGEVDPDGYSISIDGQPGQSIGSNATLTLEGIAGGPHTVTLSGIAGNCGVGGQNPQPVSVLSGSTASLSFEVTCSSGTGSIQVVTATSGPGTDPDGFALLLDGTDHGSIGVSTTASITGLTASPHSIGLSGLAANCQISGENPRTVSVPAGGTAQVAFAISCTAPGVAPGTLEIVTVTTGPAQGATGYLFSIDGGPNQPIGRSATVSLANVSAVQHTITLRQLPTNCSVTGANPLGVVVQPAETSRVSFGVTCVATVGSLVVTIAGLPAGVDAKVTVSGPNNFSRAITRTSTLTGLTPGSYGVSAQRVTTGGIAYAASVSSSTVAVAAGASPGVTVSYTPPAAPTLNLRIQSLYITQSTQTLTADVPLVAGRPGYLRAFVVANQSNSAKPRVRVTLSTSTQSFTIEAPGASTPTQVQEGVLGSSWNLPIPGSLIQSGLSIMAEVDPNTAIDESNETDNRFPATGTEALTVRSVAPARIRFVSVQQGASAPGNVSAANKDQMMDMARRIYPLNGIDTDVDPEVFTASLPLEANGGGWSQLLSDLDGKRVDEGTNRTYFGVVKLGYGRQDGYVGLTLGEGVPTSAGWDDPSDARRVVAHELGHTWGRKHTVCGGPLPATIDPLYPYSNGQIGVSGFDVANTDLKPASSPDIMGYCFQNPWISDYTYQAVMNFRQANAAVTVATSSPQQSVLIWGRIENGRPVLEPAFQIVTRASLPTRPGPYSVTGSGADGSQLFSLSFDVTVAEDGPRGNGHFAFAVPLDRARASQLASLRLSGPGGLVANSRPTASLQMGAAVAPVSARREGQIVVLQWNPSVHPTIMVRDPDTGRVLSFARGGNARIWTSKGELDLELSDGVKSQRVRLAISRS